MRAYTVAAAAVTLQVSTKWLDNVLSHHHVQGVSRKRQGVTRRLTPRAILTLELALRLSRTCGSPLSRALELSKNIIGQENNPDQLPLGEGLFLLADLRNIESELMTGLAHAVEIAPNPRRGRPPSRNDEGCLSAPLA